MWRTEVDSEDQDGSVSMFAGVVCCWWGGGERGALGGVERTSRTFEKTLPPAFNCSHLDDSVLALVII